MRLRCWLQALPYVALLIVMLFFIYAVIGMQVLFALVALSLSRILFCFHSYVYYFALLLCDVNSHLLGVSE